MKYLSILLTGISLLMGCQHDSSKVAYMVNQKVFDGYQGTKEAKTKLAKIENNLKKEIDSLVVEIKVLQRSSDPMSLPIRHRLEEKYKMKQQEYIEMAEGKLQEYNNQIWNQINQYVNEYGRAQGYTYIYGANGSGAIMYADSTKDISNEVIAYINTKYKGQ